MDGATLQGRIYHGYAQASAKVGTAHTQYRPSSAINPLGTALGTLLASFNIGGSYANQAKQDQILWQAVLDGTQVDIGDYLVGAETWAIIGKQALMPVLAMRCTDTLSMSRRNSTPTQGPDGTTYGTTQLAAAVPCYVQLKRDKGFSAPAGFQGGATNTSAPIPEWNIFVCLGGVTPAGFFQPGDVITTGAGETLKIDAASTSTVMWQLACTPYKPNA